MGTRTPPVRIDDELYDSAKEVASLLSRSTAQQIVHWARLGRELETDPDVAISAIAEVLAGRASYDDLPEHEQAIVRVRWAEAVAGRLASLRLDEEFAAEGRSYVELDADGRVVHRDPADR